MNNGEGPKALEQTVFELEIFTKIFNFWPKNFYFSKKVIQIIFSFETLPKHVLHFPTNSMLVSFIVSEEIRTQAVFTYGQITLLLKIEFFQAWEFSDSRYAR